MIRTCTIGSTWRARKYTSKDCRRASVGSGSGSGNVRAAFNAMVERGELAAPIVIGRDHLDSGSVASPNRETEAVMDGSDAVTDWRLLNALLNTASGATWVSITTAAASAWVTLSTRASSSCATAATRPRGASRACSGTTRTGVIPDADAGYQIAIDCAREISNMPMIGRS